MKTKVTLHRDDINKIVDIMQYFPEVNTIDIIQKNCSIGDVTSMEFTLKLCDIPGKFNTEISGVENW